LWVRLKAHEKTEEGEGGGGRWMKGKKARQTCDFYEATGVNRTGERIPQVKPREGQEANRDARKFGENIAAPSMENAKKTPPVIKSQGRYVFAARRFRCRRAQNIRNKQMDGDSDAAVERGHLLGITVLLMGGKKSRVGTRISGAEKRSSGA